MAREHVVSMRFDEKERAQLQALADRDGITMSEAIRRMVRQTLSPPLPNGNSVGSAVRLVEHSGGWMSSEGIVWANGTPGGSLTVGPGSW